MLKGGHLSSYFKSRFLLFGLEKEKEREREFSKQIRLALSSIVEWHALMTLAFHWPSGSYPLSCDRDNKKRTAFVRSSFRLEVSFFFVVFFFSSLLFISEIMKVNKAVKKIVSAICLPVIGSLRFTDKLLF